MNRRVLRIPLRRDAGFSLLEVLVALLVFSIGLIGLAGLMVLSVRTNHSSYLRSQAVFLAENIADRMRANVIGVWQGNYDASKYPVTVTALACDAAAACAPKDVADRDKDAWGKMLTQLLPSGAASIACTPRTGVIAPTGDMLKRRPPYDGTCTLRIEWSEQAISLGKDAGTQRFSWVFQP